MPAKYKQGMILLFTLSLFFSFIISHNQGLYKNVHKTGGIKHKLSGVEEASTIPPPVRHLVNTAGRYVFV